MFFSGETVNDTATIHSGSRAILKMRIFIALLAAVFVAADALPSAATPNRGLKNAHLDDDGLSDSQQGFAITDWFESSTALGNLDDFIIRNSSSTLASGGFGAAGNSTNVLGLNTGPPDGVPGAGYVYQEFGDFTPGELLQFTGDAVRRDSHDFADFTISIYVGSGVGADGTDVATFATLADSVSVSGSSLGLRVNSTFTFANTGVNAASEAFDVVLNSGTLGTVGDPVWVRFSADTVGQFVGVYLDNLSAPSDVPEPSTLILAALAMLSLFAHHRRRRA